MNADQLHALLANLPVPAVRWLETTGSTNDDAAAWAASGAPDGALVAADTQMGGRGRLGRKWVTRPGAALAFSLVIRLESDETDRLAWYSPLGALAVTDSLEKLGLDPQIKWPNDILLEKRKVCGILAEATWLGQEFQGLVLGIGVNIAPSSVPPAAEVMFPAACVEEFLRRPVERFDLLRTIIQAFFARRAQLGSNQFLADWEQRLAFRGEKVTVSPPGESPLEGFVRGIDPQGNLRLTLETGEERSIAAGDVTLRPLA